MRYVGRAMSSGNRMLKIDTFRTRLTLWYVAILGATLVLFAVLLYAALARSLYRHHDAELAASASQIQALLNARPLEESTLGQLLTGSPAGDALVMVRDQSGALRYRSGLLQVSEPNIGLHEALVHAAAHGQATPQFFTTSLERSGIVRFICVPVATSPTGYVQIGHPLGDVTPTLRTFRNTSLIVLPLVVLLTSYGGWMLAGRALSPVKEIDGTLQAIQASDLSRRVRVSPTDRELQQLVTTVNQTLERLEQAFVSVRQFAADASHQLQTPLAVMKASLELAGRGPELATQEFMAKLSQDVNDMSATLTDLQALALADADLATTRSGPVDLSAICHEALEILTALAEPADIAIDAMIAKGVTVWGDALRLKQVVLNLGDNAIKYSPRLGRVRLSLARTPTHAVLEIADDGEGIDAQHLPYIFDRFYRIDRGAPGKPGTGLGLAIVKRIVEVHRGSVRVTSAAREGSSFSVTLPLHSALSQ